MKKKFIIFIIISLPILLLIFARHNYIDLGSNDPGTVSSVDRIVNEFDFIRIIKKKNLSSDDYVDLLLSADDFKHISNSMKSFTNEGFIRDKINPWRKAKVIVNGDKEKVEFKFHGTDASLFIARIPFSSRLKRKLGFNLSPSIESPLNTGTFSLKIKHKKKSNYYNLMRRYNLISPYDNHEISTIAINKIASKLGLMAPYGRTVILRINGSEIAPYKLVENHNKEWFEREHGITDYTIFTSYDDWDKKEEKEHSSGTDLYIENKKVNSISEHSSVAAGALDLLLKSIRTRNVEQVKRMIDLDYMAKYMAFLTITNDPHPIMGDNLRYVYNHATGRFKLLFREEVTIIPNIQPIANFNKSLFIQASSNQVGVQQPTREIFKLLLTDIAFLTKRDQEINKIVKKAPQWLSLINEVVADNMRVFKASSMPIRHVEYNVNKFENNFLHNISKAKKYLDYNKIFITKYTDISGKKSLRIINDFLHPITLIKSDDSDNEIDINIFIKPSQLDFNQKIIYEEQDVDIDIDISQLSLTNTITGKKIPQRHIYFNNTLEHPIFTENRSVKTLNDNNIEYKINYKDKFIVIQQGQYIINKNVVTPYGFNVTIQKNTKLLFNENISFLVRGGLDIKGTMKEPVIIDRKDKDAPFGVFAVMGEKIENTKVNINYLEFSGGHESIINGTKFTGQMSIVNANVSIKNSIFKNSLSDDGINIKYSKVDISNSKFFDNFGDQMDLDYCQAIIINNVFSSGKVRDSKETIGTDGLDVSGSKVRVEGNTFSNLSDKGISVGEISNVLINDNFFNKNNLAIAVKDGSQAFVDENHFNKNKIDISMYIKKKMYNKPILHLLPMNEILNLKVGDNTVIYSDNLNNEFVMKRSE